MSELKFTIPVEIVSTTQIFVMVPLREIDMLSSLERWGKVFLAMCTFFLGIGLQNATSPNPILMLWAGSFIASFVFGMSLISSFAKSKNIADGWQSEAHKQIELSPGQVSVKPSVNE